MKEIVLEINSHKSIEPPQNPNKFMNYWRMKMSHNNSIELSNICKKKRDSLDIDWITFFSHWLCRSNTRNVSTSSYHAKETFNPKSKKNQSCKITKLTKQKPTKIHKNTRPREAKKRKKSAKKIFAFSHRQSVTWLARKVSKAFNVRSYRWGKISGHRRDLNQLFFKHTKTDFTSSNSDISRSADWVFFFVHYSIRWLTRPRAGQCASWNVH